MLTVWLSACSTNPTKDVPSGDNYDSLYGGSSENRTANAAGIAATTAEEAIERGDDAYSQGQYDVALYEYVEALKLNGGDAETLNKVGDIHFGLGNMGNAGEAYDASLELDDKNQHALQGLGLIKLRSRSYDEAKKLLERAIDINPGLWHAHNGLGTIADIEGKYPEAIQHYLKALQLNPRSAQVLNNIGYSEYLSGNWRAAMMRFVQAVNADPSFERAWYNIGLLYTRQGNYDDAFVAFRNVLDTPQAYNDIGYICMIDGNFDSAQYYFDKAVKSSPSYYLKAHENIDKLERMRERQASTGYYRQPPISNPADSLRSATVTDSSTAEHTAVVLDERGKPIVSVAETPQNIIVTSPDGVAAATAMVMTESLATSKKPMVLAPTEGQNASGFAGIDVKSIATVRADTNTANKNESAQVEATTAEAIATPQAELAADKQADMTPMMETTLAPEVIPETVEVREPLVSSTLAQPQQPQVHAELPASKTVASENMQVVYNTNNEQAEYREALALVRDRDFETAADSFNNFLVKYPNSRYAANARYWIGETYYVTRDFEPALQIFNKLVSDYPNSSKVPDTRLKIGYIHYERSDWSAASSVLSDVIDDYPDTEVAQLANARLVRMQDEGHISD